MQHGFIYSEIYLIMQKQSVYLQVNQEVNL